MLKKVIAALLFTTFASLGFSADAQAVANGDVNLRTGPGVGYARVATIHKGTQVYMHGCIGSGWCKVSMYNATGWAFGRYLDHYRPPQFALGGPNALVQDGGMFHPFQSPVVVMQPRVVRRVVVVPTAPQIYAHGVPVYWPW